MATYEFAVKKDILNSGKIIYSPVCRIKSKFGRILSNPWQRIVVLYGEYILMELDFIPELSHKECEDHIKAYQEILKQKVENQVATVEFNVLEEKQI